MTKEDITLDNYRKEYRIKRVIDRKIVFLKLKKDQKLTPKTKKEIQEQINLIQELSNDFIKIFQHE